MYESGQRLPSTEALRAICSALGLSAFQTQQLRSVATDLRETPKTGEQWFIADDVLEGTPIFLRSFNKESEFQIQAKISEMWIVTAQPLASDGEMFEVLKQRLLQEKTKFIYFLDRDAGEAPYRSMCSRLLAEAPVLRDSLSVRLKCILSPRSICFFHFAICNPGDHDMYGRMIMYSNGIPIGFISADSPQILRSYNLLRQIYQLCNGQEGKDIGTEYGVFRLLELPVDVSGLGMQ